MIRRHKNILISIVSSLCVVVFLCLPTVTVAASDEEAHFLGTIALDGGGPAAANSPLDGSPADPEGNFRTCDGPSCDYCDLVEMIEKIIRWLVLVLSTIGVLLFVYAGFMLSSSQGDVGKRKKAKDMILSVVIGLIILLSSWMIIDVIMKAFVGGEVGVWNSVTENCGQHNKVGTVSKDPIIAEAESFTTPEFFEEDAAVRVTSVTRQVSTGSFSPVTSGPRSGFDSGGFISSGGNYGPAGANVSVMINEYLQPIFDPRQGGSSMVNANAAARMQETLAGPFSRLQQGFGKNIVINDAIAKSGTSRESNTPNSRHFHGDALDLSLEGMSNAEQLRLFQEARRAGFTGFGFGSNILHVDLGPPRGWAYGNSTYGGRNVRDLINSI